MKYMTYQQSVNYFNNFKKEYENSNSMRVRYWNRPAIEVDAYDHQWARDHMETNIKELANDFLNDADLPQDIRLFLILKWGYK